MNHREFWTVIRHMLEYQKMAVQLSWEQARFIAFWAARPHYKNMKEPKSLVAFDWESPGNDWTEDEANSIDWDKLDLK